MVGVRGSSISRRNVELKNAFFRSGKLEGVLNQYNLNVMGNAEKTGDLTDG